jgi:hypothetical protein
MGGIARFRALTAAVLVSGCVCAAFGFAGAGLARAARGLRVVRYRGFSVRVPRSWPVFELAREPRTCVRFDRHALYLGIPGAQERCPAHAVGRTDAILVAPLRPGRGGVLATAGGLGLEGDVSSYAVRASGVQVTATWSRSPRLVARALGGGGSPGGGGALPGGGGGSPGGGGGSSSSAASGGGGSRPGRSSFRASTFTGLGFDTCMAPARSQMAAWSHSPYRAIGIYLGGINMACAQPNLTSIPFRSGSGRRHRATNAAVAR